MCPPLIFCYIIVGLVYLYMVFHRWEVPSYKVLLSCKLSPAKTRIRIMINFPAYKAFAWTVFCFRSLFSLDLYVKTSYLICSNALYPLFISWWWNCTSFSHMQTNSWLVCNLKTGTYWAGGCVYVIACVNAVINQKIEPMLLIKPSLSSLSTVILLTDLSTSTVTKQCETEMMA